VFTRSGTDELLCAKKFGKAKKYGQEKIAKRKWQRENGKESIFILSFLCKFRIKQINAQSIQ
jgi:hypothetical protein